ENGKKEIEEKEPLLEKGKKEYEEGKKKIEDSEKLLTEKEQEYEAGKTQLDTARMTMQLGEMQYTLTLDSQIQEQKTIDSENQALDTREQTLATREEDARRLGVYESYASEFEKERADIQKRRGALQAQTADLSERYLENNDLGLQIANGKKEFEESEKKLEEGKKALEKGKEDLYKAKQQLLDAEKKIAQGEEELKEGKRKIEEGERQIEEGEKLIRAKSKELVEDDLKLAEAREEYLKGFGEFADGKKAYDEEVAKAEESIQKIKSRITDKEIPKSYLLGRDMNIGYMCFDSDASIVEGIANVFPVFFFLVAALICVTTMTRMVEEQRTQIGILKALGYSDGKIMFKFLFYSGSAAITGAIFGYFSGTHVFPYVIWTVYGIMYFAGPIAFSFNPMLATISLIVSLLCSVGATYLSCRKELGSNASVLMRPRSPKAGKRVFLEYVTFLWKRLSFLRKVAVRNVMRYKKRFIMMVLGIGGCTALLVTGFGLKDSIAGVAGMQYGEIQMMDVSVIMQNEIDAEFLEKLDKLKSKGVDEYLVYMEKNLDLVTDKGQKSVTVLAFPEKEMNTKFKDFYYLTDAKGTELITPGLGEAIVTDKMAKILGIKVGAEITLQTSEMKEMRVTITGIAKNHLFNYVYMSDATWENGLEETCRPMSFCVKVAKDKDPGEVTTRIYKLDGVASVTITREVVTRFDTMMQSMNLIVILVTACAAGLAFIVLYNLTNINVTERIREIATIKVLGFFAGETALYVFRENFLLTILGAFVGLFMGKWLHAFVMSEINLEMVSFGTRILPTSYVYSVLLTILFSLLVSLIMNRRLEAISMTESLKSVD
ncbi:MAG: FtsX-like permease family protein, partial [Acetatifactor sp.]|nr:FtsX-like permease family protein [Acetatifactor sp.]